MQTVQDSTFSTAIHYLEQHEKHEGFPDWMIRHQKEVFLLAYRMGELLGFNAEQLTDLSIAARFHDIGKAHVDPEIINHNGTLTDTQRYAIFEHVHQSHDILKIKGINSRAILEGVFYHHENYDGSGYPDKLKGDEIPVEAQILRVVDSFSAMLGSRPYHNRSVKDFHWAIRQIEKYSSTFYNPKIVNVFLKIVKSNTLEIDNENLAKSLQNMLFDKPASN